LERNFSSSFEAKHTGKEGARPLHTIVLEGVVKPSFGGSGGVGSGDVGVSTMACGSGSYQATTVIAVLKIE